MENAEEARRTSTWTRQRRTWTRTLIIERCSSPVRRTQQLTCAFGEQRGTQLDVLLVRAAQRADRQAAQRANGRPSKTTLFEVASDELASDKLASDELVLDEFESG